MGQTQNDFFFFLAKITKADHQLSLSILSKDMFWLSCESFSTLCDVFCQKGSFPAKTAVNCH